MIFDVSRFYEILGENGLERFRSEKNYRDFMCLAASLEEFNSHTNITAIKDIEAVAVKHYADSLCAEPLIARGARVADIGCGGGFPSLPLAKVRNEIKLLLVDHLLFGGLKDGGKAVLTANNAEFMIEI